MSFMQHQLRLLLQSKLGWLGGLALALSACRTEATALQAQKAGTQDGDLAVLLPRDIQQLDPRFVGDAYGLKLSRLLFASLVRVEPQTLEPVPDLAERVTMISDVEYHAVLRPDLHFSDGSVLDAQDVVATYRSIVDPAMHARYASAYQRIRSVTARDARTIVFELTGPHASFMTDLELPILRSEDAQRRLGLDSAPVGAGPYVLSERHAGGLTLSANPHWYQGVPRVPHVRMLVVRDDNTRALRMLSGAADYTLNGVPPGLLPLFTHDKGFAVESAAGVGTTFLGVNTLVSGLRDVRVRKALALAIDRRSLIAAKLQGRAELASSFVPNGHWAYAADTPSYAFDPAAARALLDAAGLHGTPRAHWVMRCSAERSRVSVARAIAAMLADVGIAVRVQPSETATLLADLDRGHFELTLLQFPEVIEPHVLSWVFASERIPGPGREGLNRWRYRDPELDAALELGRVSADREARLRAYRAVQLRLAEQLPIVPLWHEAVVAVRTLAAPALAVPRDGRFTQLARAQ